jgi:ABC-type sulfate transport system permease component
MLLNPVFCEVFGLSVLFLLAIVVCPLIYACSTSGTHRATFTKIRATSDKRVKGDGSAATTNGTHP